jgi:acylphosphatase
VQAWLEGSPAAVEAVIAWCREGPPRARVERVEVAASEPRGLDGFEVR